MPLIIKESPSEKGEYHVRISSIYTTKEVGVDSIKNSYGVVLETEGCSIHSKNKILFRTEANDEELLNELCPFFEAALGKTFEPPEDKYDDMPWVAPEHLIGRQLRIVIDHAPDGNPLWHHFKILCFLPKIK